MARTIGKLSARKVETVKEPGFYGDGGGLWLQVSIFGTKSWVYRFTRQGKRRHMGLGPVHTVSLSEARAKALECRKLVLNGADPIENRTADRQASRLLAAKTKTFKECAEALIDSKRAGWKNAKHAQQWENTLKTYAYPLLGALPVASIDTGLVMECIKTIWQTKTETATRVRQRIESVLDSAKAMGYRTGDNPAAWKGHLDSLLAAPNKVTKKKKQPSLPHAQINAFLREAQERGSVSAMALEFTILTAARTEQAVAAQWSEIDLTARTWKIPGERMKAGREHVVPLSDRVVELLEKLKPLNATHVFPGAKDKPHLSTAAMDQFTKGLNEARAKAELDLWVDPTDKRPITVHGFRSTFRDWAGECTNYPREVAEHALAHGLADKTEAAYFRSSLFDKRKLMMAEWAKYCAMVQAAPGSNVVPIGKQA